LMNNMVGRTFAFKNTKYKSLREGIGADLGNYQN
jgi:hypothetical protein